MSGRTPRNRRVAFLFLLLAFSAGAYILPASAVLRRMTDARDEQQLSTLRLDGTITFTGEAARKAAAALRLPEGAEVQADATVWMRVPGRCRLDVTPVEGGKVSVVQSMAKRRAEGGELPGLALALEHLCPLLASRSSTGADSRSLTERYLASLKLGERTTSLGRFGGQVTYVIGNPAENHAQLWIYKDSFQPARVRIPDATGTTWDIRFLDFASPVSGEAFPRIFEVRKGEEPVFKFTALKDSRGRVDDRLF